MTDRSHWPIKKMTLAEARAEQFPEDLSETTTSEERIAMMWQLALDAWSMQGVKVESGFPRHLARIERRRG
jgi:hypothetical protein